jgi:hypothetical protein
MSSLLDELRHAFRKQQRFADGYSPLYAHLFGILADWLGAGEPDPLVEWLLQLAAARRPFDLTLLLPAALHREVLAGAPEAAPLAAFYPTAGGRVPDTPAPLAAALRSVILARRETLEAFIRRANVQTNETGRGLAWLLPVAALGWSAVHLVELGASAGLNLVAERRDYRLAADALAGALIRLGAAEHPQFDVNLLDGPDLSGLRHLTGLQLPTILSRTGGDIHPFHLRTTEDELTLAAFVWADQPARLTRLREGIAALRAVESTAAPVRLRPLHLPDELPRFLAEALPRSPDAPVVLYNTIVTMYLPESGAGLRRHVELWARRQPTPVLWLQWEPSDIADLQPPQPDWSAWSADLWQAGVHRRLHLGWVHPHGAAIRELDLSGLLAP